MSINREETARRAAFVYDQQVWTSQEAHPGGPNALFRRWEEICGGELGLRERLGWQGLRPATNEAGSHSPNSEESPPSWVTMLETVLQSTYWVACAEGSAERDRAFDNREPIAFEELLLPFLLDFRSRVNQLSGSAAARFTIPAMIRVERRLLWRLCYLAAPSLYREFRIFKLSRAPVLCQFAGPQSSRLVYDAFLKEMAMGGFSHFFETYSVLGRLMATVTSLHVEAIVEMLLRLDRDWVEIERSFPEDAGRLGIVEDIQPSLSDPHNCGRTVAVLRFESGRKLVYKPKDVGLEVAFYEFLNWLNENAGDSLSLQDSPPFCFPEVLDRVTHGWVQFVEAHHCAGDAELRNFYERGGMLLGLLYLLHGTDMHKENIVASGEYPVLIDLETLLHSRLLPEFNLDVASAKFEHLGLQPLCHLYSVLQCGFLPRWERGPEGTRPFDLSGLGGTDPRLNPARFLHWHDANTDSMLPVFLDRTEGRYQPDPSMPAENLNLADYLEDVVRGFRRMYLFLIDRRDTLCAGDGPLQLFRRRYSRFVFRPTKVYGTLLARASQTDCLMNGMARSIELDRLSRPLLKQASGGRFWAVLKEEHQAMDRLDVPSFLVYSDRTSIEARTNCADPVPTVVLENCFEEPPFDQVMSTFREMDEDDCRRQTSLIRAAWHARCADELHAERVNNQEQPRTNSDGIFTPDRMLEEAIRIATNLERSALQVEDGLVWTGLIYSPTVRQLQVELLGFGLYDGVSGIALFLAAVARITGNSQTRDFALQALAPLRKALQAPEAARSLATKMGIGAALGSGSLIYALVRIAQLLGEPALVRNAAQLASGLDSTGIESDRSFDVFSGSAGLILCLLALHEVKAQDRWIDLALVCGRNLLRNRTTSIQCPRSWQTVDETLMTGFSHGAAGIAFALLRLFRATGDQKFRSAAEEAVGYEDAVFSASHRNWPDLRARKRNDPFNSCSWCHGAPGIGLARLAGLHILSSAQIRKDIEIALQFTSDAAMASTDDLCCGNMGRALTFEAASRILDDHNWLIEARQVAGKVIGRSVRQGEYATASGSDSHQPGLFQGSAGIGFGLLRLAGYDKIPLPLTWQ